MKIVAAFAAWIGGLILVVGLSIGGWQLHWFLAKSSVGHQYDINTGTQQYQASLIDAERNRIQGYDAATDAGQKAQIASTFCAVFPTINPATSDLVSANARICN